VEVVLAGKLVIIDVRTRGEFKSGHVKGAINIPYNEFFKGIRKNKIYPDHRITIYCASGGRSAAALNILKSQGYKYVTNGGSIGKMLSRT